MKDAKKIIVKRAKCVRGLEGEGKLVIDCDSGASVKDRESAIGLERAH